MTAVPNVVRSLADASAALVLADDARWLRTSDGTVHELPRQRSQRLILLALAKQRLASPGSALTTEDLLGVGWPGERVLAGSGAHRVHVAISALRARGLRDVLVRHEDGYLLRPDAEVRVEAGPHAS